MKALKYIIIFNLFFIVFAQDTWVRTYAPFDNIEYGDDLEYHANSIVIADDGGYVLSGGFSKINLDEGHEEYKTFLIKTDVNGDIEWISSQNNTGHSFNYIDPFPVTKTSDGGYLRYSGYIQSIGHSLTKTNSNGDEEWVMSIDDFRVSSIDKTLGNNIILAGRSIPKLCKISEVGNVIWSQSFDFLAYLKSVIHTSDGGVLAIGSIYGYNPVIIKVNEIGELLWFTELSESSDYHDASGLNLIETYDGKICAVGYTRDSSSFNYDSFIWMLDSLGNTLWVEFTENDSCAKNSAIIQLQDSSFVVAKYTTPSCPYNLIKYNDDFDIVWERNVDITYSDKPIMELENGGFVFIDNELNWAVGDWIILTKTDSLGLVYENSNSNDIILPKLNLMSSYPNPFNPKTTIQFTINSYQAVKLQIFDLTGKQLETLIDKEMNLGKYEVEWDASKYPSGTYFAKLTANGYTQNHKLMLVK